MSPKRNASEFGGLGMTRQQQPDMMEDVEVNPALEGFRSGRRFRNLARWVGVLPWKNSKQKAGDSRLRAEESSRVKSR